MPISRLVKYALLSSSIFLGSTVAVQAQSTLPGCADKYVKETVLEIIVENLEREIRKNETLIVFYNLDWRLDAFSLAHITLAHYNEHTGALTCHATLQGQKDRQYFSNPLLAEERKRREAAGYWDYQDITAMQYNIAQSAEDPDYYVDSVVH